MIECGHLLRPCLQGAARDMLAWSSFKRWRVLNCLRRDGNLCDLKFVIRVQYQSCHVRDIGLRRLRISIHHLLGSFGLLCVIAIWLWVGTSTSHPLSRSSIIFAGVQARRYAVLILRRKPWVLQVTYIKTGEKNPRCRGWNPASAPRPSSDDLIRPFMCNPMEL